MLGGCGDAVSADQLGALWGGFGTSVGAEQLGQLLGGFGAGLDAAHLGNLVGGCGGTVQRGDLGEVLGGFGGSTLGDSELGDLLGAFGAEAGGGVTLDTLADVAAAPGAELILDVGDYEQAFVLVYAGNSVELTTGQLGVYGPGATLALWAGESGFEALVLAGAPLHEPIAQYGPFVMNRPEELDQALRDYRQGQLTSWQQGTPRAHG